MPAQAANGRGCYGENRTQTSDEARDTISSMGWVIIIELGLLVLFGFTIACDVKQIGMNLERLLHEVGEAKKEIEGVESAIMRLRR
jgi:hypothetical protein